MHVSIFQDFLRNRGDNLRDTPEETINAVLEHLNPKKEKGNVIHRFFAEELMSSAAIIAFALPKINNPLRLLKNFVVAFERRGACIYTGTFKSAFSRLLSDSIKKDKQQTEIAKILRSIKNIHTFQILFSLRIASKLKPELVSGLLRKHAINFVGVRKSSIDLFELSGRELVELFAGKPINPDIIKIIKEHLSKEKSLFGIPLSEKDYNILLNKFPNAEWLFSHEKYATLEEKLEQSLKAREIEKVLLLDTKNLKYFNIGAVKKGARTSRKAKRRLFKPILQSLQRHRK